MVIFNLTPNDWQLAAPKIYNPTSESVAVGVGYIALLCDEALK